jgi:Amt family ammonium transporter
MNKHIILTLLFAIFAYANDLDTGDTAWMMVSTALVLFMSPAGLALFYAGMTRSKNVLNTYAMVFSAFIVAFVIWVIVGYSLAFSTNSNQFIQQFIGNFDNIFLNGISWQQLNDTYPTYVFVAFQGTFAAITVAVASGSIIERLKFSTWIIIVVLWELIVYAPIAHMVWGGNGALLFDEGALDFAGGTVVHMNGGLAGLVLAILVGKRADYGKVAIKPISVVLTALGAAILWFGWYGFNAGSAFGANKIAGVALLSTTVAAAIGGIAWMLIEWVVYKKPTLLGMASGVVAGLVAITPAAGFVNVSGSIVIGSVGSIFAFWGITYLKKITKYDDSLDAFGVHFLAGLWGALATGIFALNDKDLLWDGPLKESGDKIAQFIVQVESVIFVGLWTLIGTIIVYFIAKTITNGSRVDAEKESMGLDESVHGEKAFNL